MSEQPRSLVAQWRKNAKSLRMSDDGTKSWHNEQGHADGLEEAADQLEQTLTALADLEAEMRRFAEQQQWQPIDTAPHRRKLLVSWVNELGKCRTALAEFWPAGELAMDDDVPDDAVNEEGNNVEGGWFESREAGDGTLYPLTEPLTHWKPLPSKPDAPEQALAWAEQLKGWR